LNNEQYAFRDLARQIVAKQISKQIGLSSDDYRKFNTEAKAIVVNFVEMATEIVAKKTATICNAR
jgi:hypothetical protein